MRNTPSSGFSRENARTHVNKVQREFVQHFEDFGCLRENPVKISSGIDPTVRFIGSHISVLKPYLADKPLPDKGVVILQDCVRTRNLKRMGDESFFPKWGSFFPSLGGLVPYRHLASVSEATVSFFTDRLRCDRQDLILRVNTADNDLTDVCHTLMLAANIEIDAMPEGYYRHKVGMDNVKGRNFNLAFKNRQTGTLEDVGNVIVLEKDSKPHTVEIAIGATTTLKEIHFLDHILDCHPLILPKADFGASGLKRQMEDAIITSLALIREGLEPSNKDNRCRILKKYTESLNDMRLKTGMERDQLIASIEDYEEKEYGNITGSVSKLVI